MKKLLIGGMLLTGLFGASVFAQTIFVACNSTEECAMAVSQQVDPHKYQIMHGTPETGGFMIQVFDANS